MSQEDQFVPHLIVATAALSATRKFSAEPGHHDGADASA